MTAAEKTEPQTYRVSKTVDDWLRELAITHGGINRALLSLKNGVSTAGNQPTSAKKQSRDIRPKGDKSR